MKSILRRIRFSLKHLIIAVTLLSIFLGGWLSRAHRQRVAVDHIQSLRGVVLYDFCYKNGRVVPSELNLSAESPYPKFLIDTFGRDAFHCVLNVTLRGSDFDKQDLWVFDTLHDLEVLKLPRGRIPNEDIEQLKSKLPSCRIYD